MSRLCRLCCGMGIALLTASLNATGWGQTGGSPLPPTEQRATPAEEPIDFAKARELFRRRQNGAKLTPDEEAYVRRALEARQPAQNLNQESRAIGGKASTGLVPLDEMPAEARYFDQDGGLYGGGVNVPPASHLAAAQTALTQITPLDAQGHPAADGKIGLVSISMSNATQEFSMFKQLADADRSKSPRVAIVDCAQGGQAMAEWAPHDAAPWREAERRLAAAGVSPAQVQVAWVKLANKGPRGSLAEHGKKLQADTLAVLQNAKRRFPNLRIAYLSSRIYGGYASGPLNPEPYAYESAFAVRWLIQDQMSGQAALQFRHTDNETAKVPLLLWGPYLWADGERPRTSDGLHYLREDLAGDGTHPSQTGRRKVAEQLLTFFKSDPLATPWFVQNSP